MYVSTCSGFFAIEVLAVFFPVLINFALILASIRALFNKQSLKYIHETKFEY